MQLIELRLLPMPVELEDGQLEVSAGHRVGVAAAQSLRLSLETNTDLSVAWWAIT